MKDKKIFKKWWFWAIVIILILGAIGSLDQSNNNKMLNTSAQQESPQTDNNTTLPKLNADDFKGKEGLLTYKELKSKGYQVNAEFENQVLTDMNGKASNVFEPLDPNKTDDRLSVDTFIVSSLTQVGDAVTLHIFKSSN